VQLVVTMTMRTAAFFDPEGGIDGLEPARILHKLADDIEAIGVTGGEAGVLLDLNGNTVGAWRITPIRDEVD
jgi:hypothetical protein